MSANEVFLYFHGGPGLQSFCEEAVLTPLFLAKNKKIAFWNEPCSARPAPARLNATSPFDRWLESAENFLLSHTTGAKRAHLVGHCFSINPIRLLAQKYSDRVASLTFISGGLNLHEVQKNILRLAISDFNSSSPERSKKLQSILKATKTTFDPVMSEGFLLALEDPILLSHYWRNKEAMKTYLDFFSLPNGAFDTDAMFSVLSDFGAQLPKLRFQTCTIPTQFIYGEHDPITSKAVEREVGIQSFTKIKFELLANSGHYPHLEEAAKFTDLVCRFTSQEL